MMSPSMETATGDHPVGIHLRAFNWQLWRARRRLGYTQHQLAEAVGISLHRITQFETLKRWPRTNEAVDLALALNIDECVLFPDALRERCANVPASVRFSVPLSALPAREEPALLEAPDMLESPLNDALGVSLAAVLEELSPREQKVLRLRFGLNRGEPHSLRETGKVFGVTPERIRQMEAKALRKLRHPSRSKKLKDYLEE